jgi:hypothetical protein
MAMSGHAGAAVPRSRRALLEFPLALILISGVVGLIAPAGGPLAIDRLSNTGVASSACGRRFDPGSGSAPHAS